MHTHTRRQQTASVFLFFSTLVLLASTFPNDSKRPERQTIADDAWKCERMERRGGKRCKRSSEEGREDCGLRKKEECRFSQTANVCACGKCDTKRKSQLDRDRECHPKEDDECGAMAGGGVLCENKSFLPRVVNADAGWEKG